MERTASRESGHSEISALGDAVSPPYRPASVGNHLPAEEDFSSSGEKSQPVFTVNPEEVTTYRVVRRTEVELVYLALWPATHPEQRWRRSAVVRPTREAQPNWPILWSAWPARQSIAEGTPGPTGRALRVHRTHEVGPQPLIQSMSTGSLARSEDSTTGETFPFR